MAGHYGAERVTIKNLKVVDILPDKNLLLVQGGVPEHPMVMLQPILSKG